MFTEANDAIPTFLDNLKPSNKEYKKAITTRNNLLKNMAEYILNSSEEKWVIQNRLEQIDDQVKSRERVVDLAEVLTNRSEVEAMIKLVNHAQYEKDKYLNPESYYLSFQPLSTWLEPAVGDGNFMVVILSHKLARNAYDFLLSKRKQADNIEFLEFEILKSVSSMYAVDIDRSNVDKTRGRLHRMSEYFYVNILKDRYSLESDSFNAGFNDLLTSVLQRNIILGNTISDNKSDDLNTHKMHLVEYKFNDESKSISMRSFAYAELVQPDFTPEINFKEQELSELAKVITNVSKVNKILKDKDLEVMSKEWKKHNGDTVMEEVLGAEVAKKELEKQAKAKEQAAVRKLELEKKKEEERLAKLKAQEEADDTLF